MRTGCIDDQGTDAVKLPIDTSGMTFMAAAPARPVTDFETKQHRVDGNGELLYNLQVVALDPEGAQIITLRVAGDPGVRQGAMLELDALVALPWQMGDRSGVAFRVNGVKVQGPAAGQAPVRAVEKAA
jgi:hypothetical protein